MGNIDSVLKDYIERTGNLNLDEIILDADFEEQFIELKKKESSLDINDILESRNNFIKSLDNPIYQDDYLRTEIKFAEIANIPCRFDTQDRAIYYCKNKETEKQVSSLQSRTATAKINKLIEDDKTRQMLDEKLRNDLQKHLEEMAKKKKELTPQQVQFLQALGTIHVSQALIESLSKEQIGDIDDIESFITPLSIERKNEEIDDKLVNGVERSNESQDEKKNTKTMIMPSEINFEDEHEDRYLGDGQN